MFGRTLDLGFDARTQRVEDDDFTKTRHFERDGVDGHSFKDLEELVLDVECREGFVRKRFKPAFDSFEKIVVENRLLEVISVMVKGCTEVVVSVSGRSDGCI